MEQKDIDWETLLNFNYDKNEDSDIDLNDLEIYKKDEELSIYEKDYKSLVSADSILKNKSYYQIKYSIIAKHLINMDDFYLILENIQNKTVEKSNSLSSIQSENKSKISISSGSEIKNDLNNFKLGYTKKLLDIFENEKMTGTEFEEYARRTLYLMFLMIRKSDYVIYNPKKIILNRLTYFINKYSEKKESFTFVKKESEIDVIINDFEKDDFYKLLEKYPNNFYFKEQLHLKELKDTKFNVVGEIERNLINQSNKKLHQVLNYINILKYLNLIREINTRLNGSDKIILSEDKLKALNKDINFEQDSKDLEKSISSKKDLEGILKSFYLKDISNNNIFLLITNGPYLLFRIIFNILNEILSAQKDIFDKQYVENKIQEYNNILTKLTESNKSIFKKIEDLYNLFSNLRKNNINHCVLYIGTNSENMKNWLINY